ncbi:hypothetical protein DFJ77DRAFT_479119 [Powellomyces hirtus]|nr:hypothetical protein DFJ77DRAFT_479119 [Powellomyces hirtus]
MKTISYISYYVLLSVNGAPRMTDMIRDDHAYVTPYHTTTLPLLGGICILIDLLLFVYAPNCIHHTTRHPNTTPHFECISFFFCSRLGNVCSLFLFFFCQKKRTRRKKKTNTEYESRSSRLR